MILGQLKMGEHQGNCGTLVSRMFFSTKSLCVAASLQPSSISDKSRCHQAVQCNIAKYKRAHCIPQLSECNFETEHYKVALCQIAHCIPQSNECNAILKPNITMQPKIAMQFCTQQYFALASISELQESANYPIVMFSSKNIQSYTLPHLTIYAQLKRKTTYLSTHQFQRNMIINIQ